VTTGAITALCTLAAPAYNASAAPNCQSGDVCLQLTSGKVVVAHGGRGSWSPPLQVDQIDNNTSTTSCVETGLIIYMSVPANTTVSGNWTVYAVTPGPACPG
jgi:hypothetical protein